jgi:UDP-N-acetylmuramate--alanine ligase
MGISGSGCSGAAALAQAQGFEVSGCDINLDQKELSKILGSISLYSDHHPSHLKDRDFLVISPAVSFLDPKNKEIQEANARRIAVLTWQEFVGKFLLRDKFVIAVCGTHGKSTTCGMLGFVLEQAGLDPWVLLGAKVLNWSKNFRVGKSNYFVIEADEYNNNFFNYHSDIAVITNIEWDHPDFFKDESQVFRSFARFVLGAKRPFSLFVPPEGIGIRKFLSFLLGKKKTTKFIELIKYPEIQKLKLQIPGEFNILNANLAYAVAKNLGVKDKIIKNALEDFEGISRRFELVGEIGKMKIFDDYAHHPQEIKETCKMAKDIFPKKKIWIFFQPHTLSRTKILFSDFVHVLKNAPVDQIFLLNIFAAREKDKGIVSSKELVEAAKVPKVQYIGGLSEAEAFLRGRGDKPDILINMGAGDIFKLSQRLISKR